MYNFFIDKRNIKDGICFISGSDYNHLKNVLRMQTGDEILVSCDGVSNLCVIDKIEDEIAYAKIIVEDYNDTNLPVKIYLFQGLPKGDKMELIIQKSVELGVEGIIPVEMNRCVVKLDDKKKKTKQARWQSIAESAAKQSKRNVIPEVYDVMNYKSAVDFAKSLDVFMVPYENKDGMASTVSALSLIKKGCSVGILIGPEGGFEESEIDFATSCGGKTVSLGKRILRTETAAVTAVGMCMLYAEIRLNGEEE